jgi:NCS1 nucleoside transporter family
VLGNSSDRGAPSATARSEHTDGAVEHRSIDWIPLNERHGKVWHQGPFWFTGGFVLTSMATGFIGPAMGLSLGWSILAVILGMAFGTAFMAFHANQGPRLGLPQMVQCRAQFGIRGSAFPLLVGIFIYIGYNVFNLIFAREALSTVLPDSKWWYIAFAAVALIIAIYGYDLLHMVQRYLSYVLVLTFLVLNAVMIYHLHGTPTVDTAQGFNWKAMLVQFAATGGYQISYAIYVSDYSRYLREDVSAKKLISWTYVGAMLGAGWMACMGAILAAHVASPDPIATVREVGNDVIPGFGTFAVLISVPALLGTSAINTYGGMLTGSSIVDSFRPLRPTVRLRVIGLTLVTLVGLVTTYVIPDNYLDSFNTFLEIMLYLLVPWTAVNLVDFYFVRRGHYSIRDLFNPRGIYGQWAWRGLTAYFLGFLAMLPFFNLSFYTGPAVDAVGGADISFIVGLLVSAVAYRLLCLNWDWSSELAAADGLEALEATS